MQKETTTYKIKDEYINTGIISVRIPKKYVTIRFNTNIEYTQEKLKKFFVYNEMRKYIDVSYKEETQITNEYLEAFDNVILISDVNLKPMTDSKEVSIDMLSDKSLEILLDVVEPSSNYEGLQTYKKHLEEVEASKESVEIIDVLTEKTDNDLTLKELRLKYPMIIANSKASFLEKLNKQ